MPLLPSFWRMKNESNDDSEDEILSDIAEWSKPPPLESIDVSLSDYIHSSVFLLLCHVLHIVTVIVSIIQLLLLSYLIIFPCEIVVSSKEQSFYHTAVYLSYMIPLFITRAFTICFLCILILQEQKIQFLSQYTVSL